MATVLPRILAQTTVSPDGAVVFQPRGIFSGQVIAVESIALCDTSPRATAPDSVFQPLRF